MAVKSIIVISGLVDATLKEYQPDVDFKMFRTLDDLALYLEKNPIRAELLFFTNDVVAGANSSFAYLKDIINLNDYIKVDRVIYITEDNAPEISSFNYLVDEFDLQNWELITGHVQRSFIQDVINGTQRSDNFDVHRKVVVRRPRADYVKEKLKTHESLQEEYVDDDHDLQDIPDEIPPEPIIEDRPSILKKFYVSGKDCAERKAFVVLAAQYLSKTQRTILLESDVEYHTITEYITKAGIDCDLITITDLYEDVSKTLERIRNSQSKLVVVGCIDRIHYSYRFMLNLLYYNLIEDFDNIITECNINEAPADIPITVVIPSTITDLLETGEMIDKSVIPWCNFVGVDLKYLPEAHVSSGLVMSKVLNDVMTEQNIVCPVVTISSLRLGDTAYDLGGILGGGVNP